MPLYGVALFVALPLGFVAYVTSAFVLSRRFGNRKNLAFAASALLGFVTFFAAVETAGQGYAALHPSYEVLFLQPDRAIGWKLVPNLEFTWAGHHWYANEFNVQVSTNSLGFRDGEHDSRKTPGMVRVAVIGDSFVEAIQVPFENRATQLLEGRLNAASHSQPMTERRWEVLNFGVSNYGIGQYLLVWEQYVSQFQPDFVFVFVGGFHMNRTVQQVEEGLIAGRSLSIRPSFRLESGRLVRVPAMDHEAFVQAQTQLIETQFAGERTKLRSRPLLLKELGGRVKRFVGSRTERESSAPTTESHEPTEEVVQLNLAIIRELGRKAAAQGCRLAVVDVAAYFKAKELPGKIQAFCTENTFSYIRLSDDLLLSVHGGTPVAWAFDGHFNNVGNQIFADRMFSMLSVPDSRRMNSAGPQP